MKTILAIILTGALVVGSLIAFKDNVAGVTATNAAAASQLSQIE